MLAWPLNSTPNTLTLHTASELLHTNQTLRWRVLALLLHTSHAREAPFSMFQITLRHTQDDHYLRMALAH